MTLHVEGPTGPHIRVELPSVEENELSTNVPDNEVDEKDNGAAAEASKPAYVN